MDLLLAIRLKALQTIKKPSLESFTRKVLRWYSKTFFTPLAAVEELPLEDVFQAYYEEAYEAMSEEEREAEQQTLLTTPEERYEEILKEEASEAELFEMARMIAASEAAAKKAEAPPEKKGQIASTQPQRPIIATVAEKPEPNLPTTAGPPPEISMTFVGEAEFEESLDGFGTMTQPPKDGPGAMKKP